MAGWYLICFTEGTNEDSSFLSAGVTRFSSTLVRNTRLQENGKKDQTLLHAKHYYLHTILMGAKQSDEMIALNASSDGTNICNCSKNIMKQIRMHELFKILSCLDVMSDT